MTTESVSVATVVASFPSAEAARRAAAALRAAGFPPEAVSLVGADETATQPVEVVQHEKSMIWRIFWAGLIWGGVGAILGAGIGVAFAMMGFPTDNMAIQVASWAMFVHIAATLWAAYAVIDQRGDTERRERRPALRPLVRVRASGDALDHAAQALRDAGAIAIGRV